MTNTNEPNLLENLHEAQTEFAIASLAHSEVPESDKQVVAHIQSAWTNLVKVLRAKGTLDQNAPLDVAQQLCGWTPPWIKEKRRTAWQDAIKKLFQPEIDAKTLSLNLNWLDYGLAHCEVLLGERITFVNLIVSKRFWTAIAAICALLVCSYAATALYLGSWRPALWVAKSYGDFKILSNRQDWGQLRFNKSVDNNPLTAAGVSYKSGLGTHAHSRIELLLPPIRRASSLTGLGAVDGEAGKKGSVVFKIFGNGKLLFESGLVTGGTPAVPFEVPVADLDVVTLIVENGNGNITWDHADWLDLALK